MCGSRCYPYESGAARESLEAACPDSDNHYSIALHRHLARRHPALDTTVMALHRIGPWTWFCGGDLAPFACLGDAAAVACLRQAIVSFTQALLLVVFYVSAACFPSVLPGALSRAELRKAFEVGSILYNVTAVLAALVALEFLAAGARALGQPAPHTWLSLLLQGAAWLTMAGSLRVRLRNPTKQVAYVWWILTFLLASLALFLAGLDLLSGAAALSPELMLVISSWPVACLLLTCAINGERWILVEVPEPLLGDGARLDIPDTMAP